MIHLYRFLINIALIVSPIIIIIRLFKRKEDLKRFKEKFTFFSKKRKRGILIWFHAASVGELLSLVSLIQELEKNKSISQILITTTTLTSSKLFEKLEFKKTVHQFFPIDNNHLTKRFLNYWKPHLAIFIDSEIWPNMIRNLEARSITKILLNARISKKSFKRWILLGDFAKNLFRCFNYTFPQNIESKFYLKRLQVKKIKYIGNLKYAQNILQKENTNPKLEKFIKTKKIWCAASTHPGEENICATVHLKLLKNIKNLVLIIIPRHVDRVDKISKELSKFELQQHIHSHTKKINQNTKIYIVDTYGETSFFFRLSKIVFMGKSLTVDGGQNPLDAARENCTIVHGSKISNFSEIYNFLDKQKISFNTKNPNQLYKKVKFLFTKNEKKIKIKDKINKIGNEILYKNLREIESLL